MFGFGVQEMIIVLIALILGLPLMVGFGLCVLAALKYLKSGKA